MATLGQQLKAAREAKGIREQDAGAATNILTKTILAMEADDFSGIAAPAYAKGFIRLYAAFLGLDPDPLIQEYLEKNSPVRAPRINGNGKAGAPPGDRPRPEAPLRKQGLLNRIDLRARLKIPAKLSSGLSGGLPSGSAKNIRLAAGAVASLLVLIVLTASLFNCSRRRAAERSSDRPAGPPARMLLDEPLPDLYLVEPGKIESK